MAEVRLTHFPVSGKDSDGQRQVVATALFPDIGWREIDGDVGSRRLEADIPHSRTDTVVTLLDCGVGKS